MDIRGVLILHVSVTVNFKTFPTLDLRLIRLWKKTCKSSKLFLFILLKKKIYLVI